MTIADSRVVGTYAPGLRVAVIDDAGVPQLSLNGVGIAAGVSLFHEDDVSKAKSLLAEAEREVARTKEDARLGIEVELWVLANCHFTGEPPYVGNAGIMLALNELKTERDAIQSRLDAVGEWLKDAAEDVAMTKGGAEMFVKDAVYELSAALGCATTGEMK